MSVPGLGIFVHMFVKVTWDPRHSRNPSEENVNDFIYYKQLSFHISRYEF